MKRVAVLIGLLPLLTFGSGCSSTPLYVTNWNSVKIGMSKEQVLELLDEPNGKSVPQEDSWSGEGESDPTRAAAAGIAGVIYGDSDEWWEYFSIDIKGLSEEEIAAKLFKLIFSPLDESFVVYFNQNGKVKKLRPPLKR